MSVDEYLTKDDVFRYLERNEPEEFEDEELRHCYEMVDFYFERNRETLNSEMDLGMAKYWLERAWIVEDEIDKNL